MKVAALLVALCSIANFVIAAPVDAPAPAADTKEINSLNFVDQDENGITLAGPTGDYYWLPLTAYALAIGSVVGTTAGGLTWWAKHKDDVAVADYSAFLAASEKLAARDVVPTMPEGTKELSIIRTEGDSVLLGDESGESFWLPMGVMGLLAAFVAAGSAAGIATLPKKHY